MSPHRTLRLPEANLLSKYSRMCPQTSFGILERARRLQDRLPTFMSGSPALMFCCCFPDDQSVCCVRSGSSELEMAVGGGDERANGMTVDFENGCLRSEPGPSFRNRTWGGEPLARPPRSEHKVFSREAGQVWRSTEIQAEWRCLFLESRHQGEPMQGLASWPGRRTAVAAAGCGNRLPDSEGSGAVQRGCW